MSLQKNHRIVRGFNDEMKDMSTIFTVIDPQTGAETPDIINPHLPPITATDPDGNFVTNNPLLVAGVALGLFLLYKNSKKKKARRK